MNSSDEEVFYLRPLGTIGPLNIQYKYSFLIRSATLRSDNRQLRHQLRYRSKNQNKIWARSLAPHNKNEEYIPTKYMYAIP